MKVQPNLEAPNQLPKTASGTDLDQLWRAHKTLWRKIFMIIGISFFKMVVTLIVT